MCTNTWAFYPDTDGKQVHHLKTTKNLRWHQRAERSISLPFFLYFFLQTDFVFMCMDVGIPVWVRATCIQVPTEARGSLWIPLELELQADVSPLTWVLGTKLRSSGRAGALSSLTTQSYCLILEQKKKKPVKYYRKITWRNELGLKCFSGTAKARENKSTLAPSFIKNQLCGTSGNGSNTW